MVVGGSLLPNISLSIRKKKCEKPVTMWWLGLLQNMNPNFVMFSGVTTTHWNSGTPH